MKRSTGIILVIAALALLAGAGWIYRSQQIQAQAAETNLGREDIVQRGTLVSTVRASGSIEPEAQVALNFATPGTVAQVNIDAGQRVKAGDALAKLDTVELEFTVAQARQAYIIQQLNYSQTLEGPAPEDVAAAEAQLSNAWAQYNDLKAPKADQLAQAQAQLEQSRVQLKMARDKYDQIKGTPTRQQELDYQAAVLAFDAAQASYDAIADGASSAQRSAVWAQVQQAKASLARLTPDQDQISLTRIQMEQAEISYRQAQERLRGAYIYAPLGGTVAEVNITQGEMAAAGGLQAAIVLADLSRFHITVDVDEIDVGRLQEGQPVTVTIEALPGSAIAGTVDQIAPVATVQGAVVSYKVTIGLAQTELPLRAGMSASISIVTEARQGVLIVPNRAIRIDRATGKTYVNLKQDQTVREIEIVTGARNESDSEVIAGLSEGDVVVTGGVERITDLQGQ